MKKATQIVLLVAGIFAIIAAVGYFFASIVYFACGGFMVALDAGSINISDFPQWAIDLIDKFTAGREFDSLAALAAALFTTGAFLLVIAILCIPAAILSFMARGKDTKGLYIACIVLGVLSGTLFPTAGGILGLIHQAVDQPKQEEPKAE